MRDLFYRCHPVVAFEVDCNPLNRELVNQKLDIDQFGTSYHLLNPCGFPMNDIMAFENAQSESVARTILQRISVNKDTGVVNDDRTIDEHFADLCPAGWSSPSEYVRYQKRVAENYYTRVNAKSAAAAAARDAALKAALSESHDVNVNPE